MIVNYYYNIATGPPYSHNHAYSPAKQSEMEVDGAVLVLSVFDHDMFGPNDFAGMCVVSCKEIPKMSSSHTSLTNPSGPQRKNLTLPLFHCSTESSVFTEIDTRAHLGDEKAIEFFKTNRTLNLLGSLPQSCRRTSVFDSMHLQSVKKLEFNSLKLN